MGEGKIRPFFPKRGRRNFFLEKILAQVLRKNGMFARVIDLFWGIFPRSLLVIQGLKNALLALSLQKPFLDGSLPVHLVAFVSRGGDNISSSAHGKKEFDLPPPVSQKREGKCFLFFFLHTSNKSIP